MSTCSEPRPPHLNQQELVVGWLAEEMATLPLPDFSSQEVLLYNGDRTCRAEGSIEMACPWGLIIQVEDDSYNDAISTSGP